MRARYFAFPKMLWILTNNNQMTNTEFKCSTYSVNIFCDIDFKVKKNRVASTLKWNL